MGAWAATRDQEDLRGRAVVSISGDGGFGQYLADFTTAVKYNMKITHILLNNSELGKISKEQRAGQWQVLADLAAQPEFCHFSQKNCGGFGKRVTDYAQLDEGRSVGTGLSRTRPWWK